MSEFHELDKRMREERAMRAEWGVNDGDGGLRLQIELGEDYAVLLSVTEEDGPRVTLWRGSGEHDFAGDDVASFKRWLEEVARANGASRSTFSTDHG
jgi:hypothetical protein